MIIFNVYYEAYHILPSIHSAQTLWPRPHIRSPHQGQAKQQVIRQ